jgi:hypothetical protein
MAGRGLTGVLVYRDWLNQTREGYLNLMWVRLRWCVHVLDDWNQLMNPKIMRIINAPPSQHRGESLEEVQRSWTCVKKDPFEEGTGVVSLQDQVAPRPEDTGNVHSLNGWALDSRDVKGR